MFQRVPACMRRTHLDSISQNSYTATSLPQTSMYPNTIALARRLAKPIIAFDLEHTGGTNATRSITDFGAVRVSPDGDVQHYSSLVKPHACAVFTPHVSRLTGIYASTVKDAPRWAQLLQEFVLPHEDALWVGFNSLSCDVPMLYRDSHRIGHALVLHDQLDLMRLGNLTGSLSKRVAALRPDFDVSGAHRGLADALMTMALLEALLPQLTKEEILLQRVHYVWRETETPAAPYASDKPSPKVKAAPAREQLAMPLAPPRKQSKESKPKVASRTAKATTDIAAKPKAAAATLPEKKPAPPPGQGRRGQPWDTEEIHLVCSAYQAQRSIEHLAREVERSPYAIACALHKAGLLTFEAREQYKQQPNLH